MFLFQAIEKPRRYGVEPVVTVQTPRFRPSVAGGTEASTAGLSFYIIPGLEYKKTSAGLRLDYTKGEKPSLSPWITSYNEHGALSFGLTQNALSVSGGQIGATLSSGIGLYYDYFGKLADGKMEIISQGGGAGDTYGMYNFVNSLKTGTGSFGTYMSGAKAIVDGGYSIFKRGIEAIWPDIKLGGDRPPTKEALASVRKGTAAQDGSDGQKTVVERELGVKYCTSVLQYEKGEPEDRRKAAIMLFKLFTTDLKSMPSGDNEFNLADWERVIRAVDKNRDCFASETIGTMKSMLDEARVSSSGTKTFGFLENAMKNGGVGGGVAGLFAGLFSADELSVGVPLGAGRIIRPWEFFEDVGGFKNTKENKGFFGKVFGFLEDVVHDVLSVPAKMVEAISPVYRRSDAWAQDAKDNISSAISENERLLGKFAAGGKIEKDDLKTLNANLTYLEGMLSAVSGSEESLAGKLREHLWKNELTYTIFTSKIVRMEMDDAIAELGGGRYKGTEIEKHLGDFLGQSVIRLSDSFVYLRLAGKEVRGKELDALKYERAAILVELKGLAKQDKNYAPVLDWQENAYKIAKSFGDGTFGSNWAAVSQFVKNGELPKDKAQQEAFGKFNTAINYAGSYSSVRQEFEKWSMDGKNRENIRATMEGLAKSIAPMIENKDGKTNLVELQNSLNLLSTMGSVFRRTAGEFPESQAIREAMDNLAKNLDFDYDELKTAGQKQKFMASLDTHTVAFDGLKQVSNGMVAPGSLGDWQKIVPDAAKTLYGLTQETEKTKSDALGTRRAWNNLAAVFGKDAVLSELSKKERDHLTAQA